VRQLPASPAGHYAGTSAAVSSASLRELAQHPRGPAQHVQRA
jgi:hypothetical protein